MTPQFVLIVIVLASFLSTRVGCLSVAGACALAVGLAQPLTDVGRSAAVEVTGVNDVTAIAKAQSADILFIVEFLFPFNFFASVHFIPTQFLCECSFHSHSIVPGGLLVTSNATRFTSRTSLVILVDIFSRVS